MESSSTDPTNSDILGLVSYLPIICAPGFDPVERWTGGEENEDGVYSAPYPIYKDEVHSFFDLAGRPCWRDPNYITKGFPQLLKDEEGIANADIDLLKAAITACVRGQRFCDDYWAAVIKEGTIKRILDRLNVILDGRT